MNIYKGVEQLTNGSTEISFRDPYHYNIAAYELARLLGLSDMVSVTVERKWRSNSGALSWWIRSKWDEGMRRKQGLEPPDVNAWNREVSKVRVFDELVYDTDPNLTNVLISEDWRVWRIDFTRAFRTYHDLRRPQNLEQCDRQVLEKLRKLDYDEVLGKTKPHLTKSEVKALIARRDKIVAYFGKLIAQKGEGGVLY